MSVLVTISSPEVIQSQSEVSEWCLFPMGLLLNVPAISIDRSKRSSKDKVHAEQIGGKINFSVYEEKLAQSFIKTLQESDRFKAVDYKKNNKLANYQLLSDNYDAVIRLYIDKLLLYKVSNEDVKLSTNILAEMVELKS
ncbi:MAG: hypothetical protein KJ630_15585 [Proteobacteria bacterium]|nr:hypothetical protein [Pseudomonadota bacterium]